MNDIRDREISAKMKEYLNHLSEKEKDELYRYLWFDHVRQDVESYNDDMDIDMDIIEIVAYRFVYDGDYDCNKSYWDNIEALTEYETRQNTRIKDEINENEAVIHIADINTGEDYQTFKTKEEAEAWIEKYCETGENNEIYYMGNGIEMY